MEKGTESEMTRDRQILYRYAEYCGKRVIYDPYDDPIMKKKMEMYDGKLRRDKRRILISLFLVILVDFLLLYLFYLTNLIGSSIMWEPLLSSFCIMGAISITYLPAKSQYDIKREKYLILEDAIMYYAHYRPTKLPNPLIIPFGDIEEITSNVRRSENRVIHLKLKGESKNLMKNIEGFVGIFEECVPDIDDFYEILEGVMKEWSAGNDT